MQLTSSIDRTRSCRTLRKILERISPDGWRMFVVMAARFEKSPKYLQRTATARKHRAQRLSCGWKLPITFSKKTICVLKRITHKPFPQTNKKERRYWGSYLQRGHEVASQTSNSTRKQCRQKMPEQCGQRCGFVGSARQMRQRNSALILSIWSILMRTKSGNVVMFY